MVAEISVVMVSYHTGEVLWPAIESVLRQPEAVELILVDNGNPDAVKRRLRELARKHHRLTVVNPRENVGFSRACNLGARRAFGKYLCFLNPDCMLPQGALGALYEALVTDAKVMAAGPRLLYADGREQPGSRRQLPTLSNLLSESLGLYARHPMSARWQRMNMHEDPLPSQPAAVPAISGACMLMPRDAFERLGGFDEGYFLHVEDLDLCKRIADAGGKALFVPQVRVMHQRSTSAAPSKMIEWHKCRGFARYFLKHADGRYSRLQMLFLRVAIGARYLAKAITGPVLSR